LSSFRIAHLSDMHFGTVVPQVAEAVIERIHSLKPDLILVTGDISQRAREVQFREARKFLDQFAPIPMISLPGNHDIPLFNIFTRLFFPYFGYTKYFKGRLDGIYSHNDIEILTLNSTDRFRHVQGALDLKQLKEELVAFKADAKLRIVAFHHPMDCKKGVDEKNLLINRAQAIQLFEKYKVDLVLGGHIHDPITRTTVIRYPSLKRSFVLSVAGTTTSYRTRRFAPNSFNIYDLTTDSPVSLKFSRYEFAENSGFQVAHTELFRRDKAGTWT
jgi:3',5'-cyclic AMP phosphodiesterase CpdA